MKGKSQNLEGYCLISSRNLIGPPFGKSLILITHHEKGEGTLGVIVNHLTKRTLGEFLSSIPPVLLNTPIYIGGPVETEILTLIGLRYTGDSLQIRSHLTPEQASQFLDQNPDGAQLRAFLGYSGWSPGQLESELAIGDWRVLPFTPAMLEPMNGDALWSWAMEQVG